MNDRTKLSIDVKQLTWRKLAQKCTYCGKVGLEEDTCFKEMTKEGGRQRGIVCYTHDKPRQTARRCPNNGGIVEGKMVSIRCAPGDSVLYPLAGRWRCTVFS